MRFRRIRHAVVDSTSERAFAELAAGRARHGDVHLAAGQREGRGRRGRAWISPEGEGLYLSAILLPPPPPVQPAALTMAAGLAALEAVRGLGAGEAILEWPNDVVARGAKLGGILVETRGLDAEAPHYVIGIGLNTAQRAFPAELEAERAVTSLALLGVEVGLAEVEEALLARLGPRVEEALGRAECVPVDYLAATGLRGRRVRVEAGDVPLVGELVDLDLVSGVALRPGDGALQRVPLERIRGLAPV